MSIIDSLCAERPDTNLQCVPGGKRFRFIKRSKRQKVNQKLTLMAKKMIIAELEDLRDRPSRGLDTRTTTIKRIVPVERDNDRPFDFLVGFAGANVRLRVEPTPAAPLLDRVREMIKETDTVVHRVHLKQQPESTRRHLAKDLLIGLRGCDRRRRRNNDPRFCHAVFQAA